jgi:putative phage-type endonuclease
MQLQRTSEWFLDRLGRFTASKIHLLYAVGKSGKLTQGLETYIYERVVEEITQTWEEADSKAMAWGRKYEPRAITLFELYYDKVVAEAPFIPWGRHSGGSPDGLVEGEESCIEVKCPFNSTNHMKHLECDTPEKLLAYTKEYYCQLQWNMKITDSSLGYFISYDPRIKDSPLHVLECPRDEEVISCIERGLEIAIPIKEELMEKYFVEI